MRRSPNLILAALDATDAMRVLPLLEHVRFDQGAFIIRAGELIEHVYFIEDGVGSMLSTRVGRRRAEVAVIGFDGLCGHAGLLMAEKASHDVVVQVEDARVVRISLKALLQLMDESASLRRTLLRYVQALFVQVGANAIANLTDALEVRLARWLLMCHDRVEGDVVIITHHFTAIMLGTHRSAVTKAVHGLEGERLVQAGRGWIRIIDRQGLEAASRGTYGATETEYRRLVAPFGKSAPVSSQSVMLEAEPMPMV